MRIAEGAAPRMSTSVPADALEERDFVDQVVEEWAREWPGDDLLGLALQSRLLRLASLAERSVLEHLRATRLSRGEYFILTTLRRAGSPYAMTAGELARSILSTSTNISAALKRLEERKLVCRDLHPDDRRSIVVSLTEAGRHCIDDLRRAGVRGPTDVFSVLTDQERVQLSALMKKALLAFGDRPVKRSAEG
jgi:DNA-binding MarR family transcriptional regulator